jgi:hypothetical protein
VAFTPDGRSLVVQEVSYAIRIRDLSSGETRAIDVGTTDAGWNGTGILDIGVATDHVVLLTERGLVEIPDDLPRDPVALHRRIAAPYSQ